MEPHADTRSEAERLLGIAEKLLEGRDHIGAREFATLAQETDPLLEGSDQMLAIADVLLAAEKRVNNYYYDWYAVLQIERRSDDQDLIKRHYRRMALLLHPDKNKYPCADQAFSLVGEAWAVLSDPTRKPVYDRELGVFAKVDLPNSKLPVKRNTTTATATATNTTTTADRRLSSFWTGCPYCYRLYEYPRVYEECCLRCQNCKRAFHAVLMPALPPLVPGKDAYYCSWGSLPFGFGFANVDVAGGAVPGGIPSWMTPPLPHSFMGYGQPQQQQHQSQQQKQQQHESTGKSKSAGAVDNVKMRKENDTAASPKKRGRPRKNSV